MVTHTWMPPNTPFTAAQVPVSRSGLRAAAQRGDVISLGHGVYINAAVVPDDPVDLHGIRALALQVRRPHLVASHETAAMIHGMPLICRTDADAEPRGTQAPGPGIRSRTQPRIAVRALPPAAIVQISAGRLKGLRLTTPARTALDLAVELSLPRALMLADWVAREAVLAASGGNAVQSRRGGAAAEALARASLSDARSAPVHFRAPVSRVIELAHPLRESAAESLSFGSIIECGLPEPECQPAIETDLGVFYPDFWWRESGVVGECDGQIKYDGSFGADDSVLVRQAERERALRSAGLIVVRWTAREMLAHPCETVARIAASLAAQGWPCEGLL